MFDLSSNRRCVYVCRLCVCNRATPNIQVKQKLTKRKPCILLNPPRIRLFLLLTSLPAIITLTELTQRQIFFCIGGSYTCTYMDRAKNKITGHWPFFVDFSKMADQNISSRTYSKLIYKWPIEFIQKKGPPNLET